MKKIWIINHYAGRSLLEKGFRAYWMAKYLSRIGYEPIIICSNTYHERPEQIFPTKEKCFYKEASEISTHYVFLSGRKYRSNGKDRVLNILGFCKNLLLNYKKIIQKYGKPDIILGSSIHPLAPLMGILIGKRIKIKTICEFRDLWPEELICMNSISSKGIIAKGMRSLEHLMYNRADAIVFTLEGGKQYIIDQRWDVENGGKVNLDKVYYINNGVDLESYKNNIDEYRLNDADLENEHLFKIVYTGTIRKANGIENILNIAKKVKHDDIRFILYGSGDEVEIIKERIVKESINNVIYKGNVSKQYIPYILSKSNVNILNYRNAELFKYGCSNNKLFEYLAAEKPIVCNVHMNYSILNKYKCGVEAESETELIDAIETLYNNKELASTIAENARNAARDFDFKNLTLQLDEIIKKL